MYALEPQLQQLLAYLVITLAVAFHQPNEKS